MTCVNKKLLNDFLISNEALFIRECSRLTHGDYVLFDVRQKKRLKTYHLTSDRQYAGTAIKGDIVLIITSVPRRAYRNVLYRGIYFLIFVTPLQQISHASSTAQ